ncbi:MAG: hypothetical protein QNJ63_23795 [Calothrix sp. MO_192.B10]|nr:hypothetical protein [Calothrix sp. MO_192.B10]
MTTTKLTVLKSECVQLCDSCKIKSDWLQRVKTIVDTIKANSDRYKLVAKKTNIPWSFIGSIHNMEASLNFNSHLHNGDSLKLCTHNVPENRPLNPPNNGWNIGYTWEESAVDALIMKNFHIAQDWSIPAQLWASSTENNNIAVSASSSQKCKCCKVINGKEDCYFPHNGDPKNCEKGYKPVNC